MRILTVRKQVLKYFRRIRKRDANRVRSRLAKLVEDSQRNDIDVVKLQRRQGSRLRSGDWRVFVDRKDQNCEIEVFRIGLRRDIYYNP